MQNQVKKLHSLLINVGNSNRKKLFKEKLFRFLATI